MSEITRYVTSSNEDGEETRIVWSHAATYDLIKEYKKHPVLYQTKDDNYNNKRKRFEALKAIKTEMWRRGRHVSIEDIKRKIHGLRTQFNFQLSKIKKSQMTARRPEDAYKPTLWCFAQLDFLKDVKGHNSKMGEERESHEDWGPSNVSVHSEDTQEIMPQHVDNQETLNYNEMGIIKEEELVLTGSPQETGPYMSDSEYGRSDTKDDDLSTFGRLVELEMRKIRTAQALRTAKRIILNALMDAQEASDS